MTKTLIVTLEIPVRSMTEQEWADAWDGCGHDEDEDEGPDRESTINDVAARDFSEAISAAMNSANNPEVLAGTGLFVHMDDALVTSIDWKP